MSKPQLKNGGERLSVESEFKAMKSLFEAWAKTGVPTGVDFPKTQSDAVGWKCERFGIKGVGSRREFRATNPQHGLIVRQIKGLIAKLRPVDEAVPPLDGGEKSGTTIGGERRVYRTQKARRIAAEGNTTHYKAMHEATVTQLLETRQTLASVERDLKVERQRAAELKRENAKLQEDHAQLKRQLAMKSGVLHAVE